MAALPRRMSVMPTAATTQGGAMQSQAPGPGNRRMSYAPTAVQSMAPAQAGMQAPTRRAPKAFEETLTSEYQDLGDQSQGMHDDPRAAYRARKRMFGFVEIFLSLAVIALILGTMVMFVLSTSSQGGTVKPADDSGSDVTGPPGPKVQPGESTISTTTQNDTSQGNNSLANIVEEEHS